MGGQHVLLLLIVNIALLPVGASSSQSKAPYHLIGHHVFPHGNNSLPSSLIYNVTHREEVFQYGLVEERIQDATCKTNGLMVFRFRSIHDLQHFEQRLSTADGTILAGSCFETIAHKQVNVANKVLSFEVKNDITLVVMVRPAHFEEMFYHANVKLDVLPTFARDYGVEAGGNDRRTVNRGQRRKLQQAYEDKNGEASIAKGFALERDYSATLFKNAFFEVNCDGCTWSFSPRIQLDFTVKKKKLAHVKFLMSGNFESETEISASLTKNIKEAEGEGLKPLKKLRLPTIVFMVGAFPVKISPSAETGYEWEASATVKGQVTLKYTASIDAKTGFEFSREKGFSSLSSFKSSAELSKPKLGMLGEATLNLAVFVRLRVTIQNILSFTTGPRVDIELEAKAMGIINGYNPIQTLGARSGVEDEDENENEQKGKVIERVYDFRLEGAAGAYLSIAAEGDFGLRVFGKKIGPHFEIPIVHVPLMSAEADFKMGYLLNADDTTGQCLVPNLLDCEVVEKGEIEDVCETGKSCKDEPNVNVERERNGNHYSNTRPIFMEKIRHRGPGRVIITPLPNREDDDIEIPPSDDDADESENDNNDIPPPTDIKVVFDLLPPKGKQDNVTKAFLRANKRQKRTGKHHTHDSWK